MKRGRPLNEAITKALEERLAAAGSFAALAREFGVVTATISDAARRRGIKSPWTYPPKRGRRECVSCGDIHDRSSGRKCVTCERRHARNGSCECGLAIYMTARTCKKCGRTWVVEEIEKAEMAAEAAAATAVAPSVEAGGVGAAAGPA